MSTSPRAWRASSWNGEGQVSPENRLTPSPGICEHCRTPLPPGRGRGELRGFCSARCRRQGWLARKETAARAPLEAELTALKATLRELAAEQDPMGRT